MTIKLHIESENEGIWEVGNSKTLTSNFIIDNGNYLTVIEIDDIDDQMEMESILNNDENVLTYRES